MSKYVKIKKNKVVFDDSYLEKFILKVDKKYTTFGKPIEVKLYSLKKTKKISSGNSTWGFLVDKDKELKVLKTAFHKGEVLIKRVPECAEIWEGAGVYQDLGKIGSTRIEVSIANQRLYYYKKGKLIKTSSTVTGKDGHSTPRGVFYISERKPGKNLVGADYVTWVNRWMRLTYTGVGLHDAYWRSNFGGTIYHSSGSHGCVNLPSSFAYWLYPRTYYKMPVIIY